jgi:hypothetical protein
MSDATDRLSSIVYGFCAFLILLLFVQWLLPPRMPVVGPPPATAQCEGEPIVVDFRYDGAINEPWTCRVQCDDKKPRYVLYTNGVATQCETPPGCNDYGEDNGITCTPPVATPASTNVES